MYRMFIVALVLAISSANVACASGVSYAKAKIGKTVAHTVTADLRNTDARVTVALARGGRGSAESFKSIVNRTKPSAAITGTFFDTRSLLPTGDIGIDGMIVHQGCIGSALCIDKSNRASIVPLSEGRKSRWDGYDTVLCAGPQLLTDGKITIALKHEGFRKSLMASTRRTAVGITRGGKLVIVAINRKASLYDLAKFMRGIGVTDALTLDGGSSTGFYYAGSYLAVPSRTMTNLLLIYSSDEKYQQAKSTLIPKQLLAKVTADAQPAEDPTNYSITQGPLTFTKQETMRIEPATYSY